MESKQFSRKYILKIALACITVLILVSVLLFHGPYRLVEPVPDGIVDIHCHVAGIGAGGSGCFVSAELRDSWKFKIYLRSFVFLKKN